MPLPDGPLLSVLNVIRQMVADCYWWRRLVDEDNPWDDETALARTHIDALPAPASGVDYTQAELSSLRPFAIVYLESSMDGFQVRSPCFQVRGHAVINMQVNVPSELADDANALGVHLNKLFGAIARTGNPDQPGLWDLAEAKKCLVVDRLSIDGYYRTEPQDVKKYGDVAMADFHLYWGPW